MENTILTAEQLIQDVTAYMDLAKESQVDRLTAIAMDESLTKLEKQAKMQEIATEKFDVQAKINSLKAVVTFEDKMYELPKRAIATKTTPINTTGKSAGGYQDGDRVKYVKDGIESPVYTIAGGKLIAEGGGEPIVPNTVSTEIIALSKGMTVEDFKAWYEAENGRKFTGVQGLSDQKHWVKVLPEVTN